jgi:glycosyltransferase involved in cell wall biosynthesis
MQADAPLVSVIIPTFNRSRLVVETVESALGQTYPNVEIVVVDDGSEDDTESALRPYLDRIVYSYQPNSGRSVARNNGIRQSTGRYCVFLDSDDLLLPGKLSLQVPFLEEHPDFALVYSDGFALDENRNLSPLGSHVYRFPPESRDEFVTQFLKNNFFPPLLALVRRDSLDSTGFFDPEIVGLEDWDLWLRMLFRGAAFAYLDGKVAVYRRHSGNTDRTEPASFVRARTLTCTKVVRDDLDRTMSPTHRRQFRLEHLGALVRYGSPRLVVRAMLSIVWESSRPSPHGLIGLLTRIADLVSRPARRRLSARVDALQARGWFGR